MVKHSLFAGNSTSSGTGTVPDDPTIGLALGAGLINAGGSNARISDSDFVGNEAMGAEGAPGVEEGSIGGTGGLAAGSAIWSGAATLLGEEASSPLHVSGSTFTGNRAIGGNGGAGAAGGNGGEGGQAGAALLSLAGLLGTSSDTTVVNSLFRDNFTKGGDGGTGGAGGNGGNGAPFTNSAGIDVISARLVVVGTRFEDNLVIGGAGGQGGPQGNGGDAGVAAGAAILASNALFTPQIEASVSIVRSSFVGNVVLGADGGEPGIDGAAGGNGGWSRGGAINVNAGELTAGMNGSVSMTVAASDFTRNVAQAGNGAAGGNGGDAFGGAISQIVNEAGEQSTLKLRNNEIVDNTAIGGFGTAGDGVGIGGGIYNSADLNVGPRDIDQVLANVADNCSDLFLDGVCIEGGARAVSPVPATAPVGDFNSDNDIDDDDTALLARALARESADLRFDVDGDHAVTSGDIAFHAEVIMGATPGDANLDGTVSFDDFLVVSANFGNENGTWITGDFDGDGNVGFSDFLLLAARFEAA